MVDKVRMIFLMFLSFIVTPAFGEMTCPGGYVLETNGTEQNCRNIACDTGFNVYGDAIDNNKEIPAFMLFDIKNMPRPKVKGPDGKWVGWSIGASQCPPDPIGKHPNPDWPCGFVYCPPLGKPMNLRIANLPPVYK